MAATGQITIRRAIRTIGNQDFQRIATPVIKRPIPVGVAEQGSITAVYFHLQGVMQLLPVLLATKMVCTRVRLRIVIRVTGLTMIQREIQITGNPDFLRVVILVTNFQIQIGIARI
jgi:hypothetical protein